MSQGRSSNKRPINYDEPDAADIDNMVPVKKPRLQPRNSRLFMDACSKAGIVLKQGKRKLKTLASQCINTETESIPSDTEYDLEDTVDQSPACDPLSPSPLPSSPVTESTIRTVLSEACLLQRHGSYSLAAERLEHTIFELQHHNTAIIDEALPGLTGLFQLWASLPHIEKEKPEAQLKITGWMNTWPARVWLEHASEVLVEMLAAAFEMEADDMDTPPSYHETWLDNTLISIEDPTARSSIKYLVQALASDDPFQKEALHRKAILAGFSHPLPFLHMIAHLVSGKRYREAHYIYEMFRLVVLFNTYWDHLSIPKERSKYRRRRELYRLMDIFKEALNSMKKHVYTAEDSYLPTLSTLNNSLKAWPEESRHEAEDMLFEKSLDASCRKSKSIAQFSEAVIDRARQRWLSSGKLEQQIAAVQGYIEAADAPRTLPVLHERLALMYADLGRHREAADLLYKFVSGYNEGVSTDYDLTLYSIAVAHEFNLLGEQVAIPTYDDALKLVKYIEASAQDKALGARLKKIRKEARTDDADAQHLLQLYQSIPEELTELNPGGVMHGCFEPLLERGLIEAKKQKLYSGVIPDFSDFRSKLDRNNGRLLQLFSSAFNHGDIAEIAGLYLEARSKIDKKPLPAESIALQWLANSRWLTSQDPSIPPLNSLQEALALVESASEHSINLIRPMEEMRDIKWSGRTPETVQEVKQHYLGVLSRLKQLEDGKIFHSTRRPHWLPSSSIPFGYIAHNVPGDGLCMYHALSGMYGISLHKLLRTMRDKFFAAHQKIVVNRLEKRPWTHGLSPSEQMMVTPIIHQVIEGENNNMDAELQYALDALEAVLLYSYNGLSVPTHLWGMDSLLQTAAVAISEISPNATPFIAELPSLNPGATSYTGPTELTQYNLDGSVHTHPHSSLNGLPLLIHTNENHWMYALPQTSEPADYLPQMAGLEERFRRLTTGNSEFASLTELIDHLQISQDINPINLLYLPGLLHLFINE